MSVKRGFRRSVLDLAGRLNGITSLREYMRWVKQKTRTLERINKAFSDKAEEIKNLLERADSEEHVKSILKQVESLTGMPSAAIKEVSEILQRADDLAKKAHKSLTPKDDPAIAPLHEVRDRAREIIKQHEVAFRTIKNLRSILLKRRLELAGKVTAGVVAGALVGGAGALLFNLITGMNVAQAATAAIAAISRSGLGSITSMTATLGKELAEVKAKQAEVERLEQRAFSAARRAGWELDADYIPPDDPGKQVSELTAYEKWLKDVITWAGVAKDRPGVARSGPPETRGLPPKLRVTGRQR